MESEGRIEIIPDDDGWAVRIGEKTMARFPATSCAVTFARTLADRAAASGERPRIVVQFRE